MSRLEIIRWRGDAVGFTGWDTHAQSELKKRLRRAVDASPASLRQLNREIHEKKLVVLEGVKEEALASVRQILETLGAEVLATSGTKK